eukprot:6186371-Pleurochrysis_carterae.AAC.2
MDVGDCVTGRIYFEIAISLYKGFVHGLYSCTFGLYTASIFVHVYNMHLYTQGSHVTRCWPVTGRGTLGRCRPPLVAGCAEAVCRAEAGAHTASAGHAVTAHFGAVLSHLVRSYLALEMSSSSLCKCRRDRSAIALIGVATFGGITEVRVRELVAQRDQVRDVGRDLANDVVQPSVKLSSRTFVALRPNNTQRSAGHAKAEKKKERYEQVEHQVPKGVATRWQETATP